MDTTVAPYSSCTLYNKNNYNKEGLNMVRNKFRINILVEYYVK